MKKILLAGGLSFFLMLAGCYKAEVRKNEAVLSPSTENIPVQVGSIIDDNDLYRSIVVLEDNSDRAKIPNNCDTEKSEQLIFIFIKNKMITACQKLKNSDDKGWLVRYTEGSTQHEFSYSELMGEYSSGTYNTVTKELIGLK
jgi:hypothetical protein